MAQMDRSVSVDGVGAVGSLDSTGKKKSFRQVFVRFAGKTSMVGVPFINTARFWWAKLIWSVLLLVAVAAMTLHLWYLFSQWYSYPKTTTVTLGFDKLEFPQVTICNTNTIHKARLAQYNGADELKDLVYDLDPRNLVPDQYDPMYDPYQISGQTTPANRAAPDGNHTTPPTSGVPVNRRKRFLKNYDLNSTKYGEEDTTTLDEDWYLFDDYEFDSPVDSQAEFLDLFTELYMELGMYDREELGHNIDDMLVSCTFNSRQCNSSQFHLHQTAEYGNCYTISSNRFLSIKPGQKAGLTLVLFLETSEYLRGITTGYGIRIQVQERGSYPFPAEEGIFVSASAETDIGIKMLKIGRLGGNFGKCDTGEDFKKLYNFTYTRRACQSFCRISTVIHQCGCYEYDYEEFASNQNKTLRPCETDKEQKCLIDVLEKYYGDKLECTCHNPCSEIDYIKSISQRQWPTKDYANVLLQWVCDRDPETCVYLKENVTDFFDVSNNFLKVNIYYEDLNFEQITESPQIEVQQLLSDVGGAIGLWIGLSILSLCELLHLFVELMYYCTHKTVKGRELNTDRRRKRYSESSQRQLDNRDDKFNRTLSNQFYGISGSNTFRNYEDTENRYDVPRREYFYPPPSKRSRDDSRSSRMRNDLHKDRRDQSERYQNRGRWSDDG